MTDGREHHLDGYAAMADEDPFKKITPQPHPTDPRIKELLGKALLKPETLKPAEIRQMAASLVYDLLSRGQR